MKLPTRLVIGLLVVSILTIGYVCCEDEEDEDVGIVEEEDELPVKEEVKLEKVSYHLSYDFEEKLMLIRCGFHIR